MKTQHTPGPWMIGMKGEHGTYNANCVCNLDGDGVCSVYGIPLYTTLEELQKSGNSSDAQGLANARLIAAAPELLKACKIALAYMEPDNGDEQESEDYAQIRNAISKAQGTEREG